MADFAPMQMHVIANKLQAAHRKLFIEKQVRANLGKPGYAEVRQQLQELNNSAAAGTYMIQMIFGHLTLTFLQDGTVDLQDDTADSARHANVANRSHIPYSALLPAASDMPGLLKFPWRARQRVPKLT